MASDALTINDLPFTGAQIKALVGFSYTSSSANEQIVDGMGYSLLKTITSSDGSVQIQIFSNPDGGYVVVPRGTVFNSAVSWLNDMDLPDSLSIQSAISSALNTVLPDGNTLRTYYAGGGSVDTLGHSQGAFIADSLANNLVTAKRAREPRVKAQSAGYHHTFQTSFSTEAPSEGGRRM